MSIQAVTDIDVLALAVRDPESRRLVEEAITAYRGGALRSATMSVWIAVVHDVFSKARELASQGDTASIAFIGKLDNAIEHKNIVQMQALEHELLDTAKDDLQLVIPHEFETLRRIQEDRHLCAHPAFITEDELFQPSPDLVRSHLVHALQCLLVHAPLQGKSALSYRDAERLGQTVVIPLAAHFWTDDIGRLLDAVLGNSQISYASGTADVLVEVFKLASAALPASRDHWQRFVDEMTAQHGGKTHMPYSYPSIRAKLDAA